MSHYIHGVCMLHSVEWEQSRRLTRTLLEEVAWQEQRVGLLQGRERMTGVSRPHSWRRWALEVAVDSLWVQVVERVQGLGCRPL